MNYLIDTNILVIYVRDTDLTRRLEENLRLLTGRNNLVISVVSIGEIKSIAKQNKWGEKRVRRLIEILSQFLIADINVEDIIESYSEIDTYSQGKLEGKATSFTSRNMGKNDLWIAATASIELGNLASFSCLPLGKLPCDLLMVQGFIPAHKGLAPSRSISLYEKDARTGHTQCISVHCEQKLATPFLHTG